TWPPSARRLHVCLPEPLTWGPAEIGFIPLRVGWSRSSRVPSPRAPDPLSPQHQTYPSALRRHEENSPVASAVTGQENCPFAVVCATCCGHMERPPLAPMPSCPPTLSPQHQAFAMPSSTMAHATESDAAMARTPVSTSCRDVTMGAGKYENGAGSPWS